LNRILSAKLLMVAVAFGAIGMIADWRSLMARFGGQRTIYQIQSDVNRVVQRTYELVDVCRSDGLQAHLAGKNECIYFAGHYQSVFLHSVQPELFNLNDPRTADIGTANILAERRVADIWARASQASGSARLRARSTRAGLRDINGETLPSAEISHFDPDASAPARSCPVMLG
jgi:hypothetical protein